MTSAESGRRKKGVQHPRDEGLGRSGGGLTTKFHLACDGRGRPLSIVITAGHRHDSTQLAPVVDGLRVPRAPGPRRPPTPPEPPIPAKAYRYPPLSPPLPPRPLPPTLP